MKIICNYYNEGKQWTEIIEINAEDLQMARCGLCGGGISNTIVPHGAICKDNKKAQAVQHLRQENEE